MLRWIAAAIVLLFASAGAQANFAIFQASSLPRGDVICDVTTGVATGVGAGTCVAHPATCNGVADDAQAFADFNTWANITWQATHTGLVEIFSPPGKTCQFLSAVSSTVADPNCGNANYGFNCAWNSSFFMKGVKRLLVNLNGSTLKDDQLGTSFFFAAAGDGVCHRGILSPDGCTARTSTVSAGATSVTLTDTSLCSRFIPGNFAFMTGFDLQGGWKPSGGGFGYPPNPAFYDHVKITSTTGCSSTGVVFFDRPLTNSYKSTWPLYCRGSDSGAGAQEADCGGPATLYALPYWWDTEVEVRGGTIDQVVQTNDQGRSVTYRNVTMLHTACAYPTQNSDWLAIGGDWSSCSVELDKITNNATFQNLHVHGFTTQSMSPRNLNVINAHVDELSGTTRYFTGINATLDSIQFGPSSFGSSYEVICTACAITTLAVGGVSESGPLSGGNWSLPGQSGGPYTATMSGGIITIPNTHGAVTWAVPGTNVVWTATGESQLLFQIGDPTQDATNTYIPTTLVGGFPPLNGATNLAVHVHPAPKFTCSSCTGGPLITSFNTAPPAAPLYSYSKVTYDKTASVSASVNGPDMWGNVSTLTFTVSGAYAGVTNPYTFSPLYQFGYGAFKSDGTATTWAPFVDLRTAGARTITASGCTGGGSGTCATDTTLTPPFNPLWLGGTTLPNISATTSDWAGTITIEMTTNQGVVNP